MDLSKHVITNSNRNLLHSNEFAVVSNGSHFGSTSNISFEQRNRNSQHRQSVAHYNRSDIGNAYLESREKPVFNSNERRVKPITKAQLQQLRDSGILSKPQLQQFQSSQQRSNGFIGASHQLQESPSRSYNPYR
jgi:hypothetical protein